MYAERMSIYTKQNGWPYSISTKIFNVTASLEYNDKDPKYLNKYLNCQQQK